TSTVGRTRTWPATRTTPARGASRCRVASAKVASRSTGRRAWFYSNGRGTFRYRPSGTASTVGHSAGSSPVQRGATVSGSSPRLSTLVGGAGGTRARTCSTQTRSRPPLYLCLLRRPPGLRSDQVEVRRLREFPRPQLRRIIEADRGISCVLHRARLLRLRCRKPLDTLEHPLHTAPRGWWGRAHFANDDLTDVEEGREWVDDLER